MTPGAVRAQDGSLTYLNQSAGQEAALKELIADYERVSGVHIEMTTQALDYDQQLLAASQADRMPDLYYTPVRWSHAGYIKEGWAYNFQEDLDAGWKDNFNAQLLNYAYYGPDNIEGVEAGYYPVPSDGNSWQIMVNPHIWEEAGVDPNEPITTFANFLEAAKQLKSVTKQAFGMNLAQVYGTNAAFSMFVTYFVSVDELVAACQGEASWTDSGFADALSLFEEMRDADILAPGAVNWQVPDCEKGFFAQQTLASYLGFAVSVPVGNRLNPDFKDFLVFDVPAVEEGNKLSLVGGPGKSTSINPKNGNVDASLEFLKWFMDTDQQLKFAALLPTIPANPAIDQSQLDPRVGPFLATLDRILPPQANIADPVGEALNKGVQQLMNKDIEVAQILTDMQTAQDNL